MRKLLLGLLFILALCGTYSLWQNSTSRESLIALDDLVVTAENVSPTKATLRFTHPNPSVLKNYKIADDYYFILKTQASTRTI